MNTILSFQRGVLGVGHTPVWKRYHWSYGPSVALALEILAFIRKTAVSISGKYDVDVTVACKLPLKQLPVNADSQAPRCTDTPYVCLGTQRMNLMNV